MPVEEIIQAEATAAISQNALSGCVNAASSLGLVQA